MTKTIACDYCGQVFMDDDSLFYWENINQTSCRKKSCYDQARQESLNEYYNGNKKIRSTR